MQIDLILYALVAAGLVFWLRSVLGTRHGDERERPNPFTAPAQEQPAAQDSPPTGDVVTLPLPDARLSLPRNTVVSGEAAERGLSEIAQIEPEFSAAKFAQGAQDAFVIIVESFAGGDRETLKNLLEASVFDSFNRALAEREQSGETVSTEIHSVRKVEILDAKIDGRVAKITMRFVADETCIVRSRDGAIVSGDPDRITEMNDIWTFSRVLRNKDPRWLLQETRDGDVREDHKTPVPDTD